MTAGMATKVLSDTLARIIHKSRGGVAVISDTLNIFIVFKDFWSCACCHSSVKWAKTGFDIK
jgi:hypothetical protein